MEVRFSSIRAFAIVLAIAALTGCATGRDAQHEQHHPGTTTSQTTGSISSGSGSTDGQMSGVDMTAACDMHRKMMSANTPEERSAMMDEMMKGMSPEMRQKHMDMMREKCK